jgi:hypothetical protein
MNYWIADTIKSGSVRLRVQGETVIGLVSQGVDSVSSAATGNSLATLRHSTAENARR